MAVLYTPVLARESLSMTAHVETGGSDAHIDAIDTQVVDSGESLSGSSGVPTLAQ